MLKRLNSLVVTLCGAIGILTSSVTLAETDAKMMGPMCEFGETVFYGQMINSRSEEKLCLLENGEYHFWTRKGNINDIVGVKITNVNYVEDKNAMHNLKGYDLIFISGDIIKVRAVYNKENAIPIAGYFIFNENTIELDPLTVVLK